MTDDPGDVRKPPAGGRSRARAKAALLLAAGRTQAVVGRECEVSERTIRRWLADPGFSAALARLQDDAVKRAAARLSHSMQGAATTLQRLLKSTNEDTRLKAAKAVLDAGLKVNDLVVLQRRVEALESAAKEGSG